MTYTFACPYPCSRVIRIDESNADDAIREIMKAGGLACRNERKYEFCEESHIQLSPLSQKQLRDAIRIMMIEEDNEMRKGPAWENHGRQDLHDYIL